ncbi:RNA polymerase-associated protein RapA [Marinobacterium jannaschii]|uniref:RNA polymerase-associated protein RapA n=1 Tax=Marinobacterium jannaschii TaxID=64970 RepID=UPI000485391A|nr:RNA polymerase-associated protein RapA [Marinobacterium jannaschii]
MAAAEFVPGQRWVSNTESELGLGIVVENADRRVTIHFPAAEEDRTYAINNAPVGRVAYAVGDQISTSEGVQLTVKERIENNGLYIYMGEDGEGDIQVVPEIELESAVQFSKPQDRLFAGQIDKLNRYRLRLDTLEHQHRLQQSDSFGLLGGRVQPLPHQFYIAKEVSGRYAPRVLLADEVGLGKTIEAGLILHQQLISGRARRALIAVPDSLVYQWLVEMLRRFNLKFSIMDELRCTAMELSGTDNPFESAQLVLCSQSFLASSETRLNQALECDWDMLIVDEAHHLGWSEEAPSHLYLTIEQLAEAIPSLLLLTATPEQLGIESHFARLRLLDPDRYNSLEQFRAEEKDYRSVSDLVQALLHEDAMTELHDNPQLQQRLNSYLGDDAADKLLHEIETIDPESARQRCISSLLDRHGTGRVLFRNTRDAIPGFPGRELNSYALQAPDAFVAEAADAPLDKVLHPETLLGDDWLDQDPRVEWMAEWLKEHRYDKALVICARADTAQALEEHMRLRKGIRSAVFHEKMTLVNRDRAAAYFADEEEYAQILVCSEIGSEGRNFQFASHLIMFDLPLNPDLLEQRIGRLDRIGQKDTVKIHVPYYVDSAQDVLVQWYHEGIDAFERAGPAGQNLYLKFAEPLNACLHQPQDYAMIEQLLHDSRIETQLVLEELQQGRDRLLEMNSCNSEKAEALLQEVEVISERLTLESYMERVYDQFGVDQQDHSANSVVLHPTDKMLHSHFPGLPEEGCTATYSRTEALSREDMQYLTWEHPMVSGAIEMILGSEYGNATVCSMKLPPLKPGTLLVEAIYSLHCAAPRELQVKRYMPQASLRVLFDSNGNDLSGIITVGHLNKLGERLPRSVAQNLVRHAREDINGLIDKCDTVAKGQQDELVSQAVDKAQTLLGDELLRLEALAKANPSIREEEIDAQQEQIETVLGHLSGASLKMEAIRVAVVSD